MGIIISILGFGFLILIHEFGHFILAIKNGVKVEEFSIGMGPRLISHQGKLTRYSIKLLPFGGSCQMKGEDTMEEDNSNDSFQSKTPLQRMSIIFAGPFMNIITALVLFSITSSIMGFSTTTVESVAPSSPAEIAGLKAGDKIIEMNGNKVKTVDQLRTYLAINGEKPMDVKVTNNNEERNLNITPYKDKDNLIKIGFIYKVNRNPNIIESVQNGFRDLIGNVKLTLFSLKALITRQVSTDNVAGPITIVKMGAQVADNSFVVFLKLIAFLSINLAVLNLLPFPALDGGWMLILFIELLTKKKINEKFLTIWNGIGFVLIMILSVLVIFKDIFYPPKF